MGQPGAGPDSQGTQRVSRPGSLSEAVSQRDSRSGSTGPRPAAERPPRGAGSGPGTGERGAVQSRSGPPGGPPPRRGSGRGSDDGDGGGGRRPGGKKKSPWRIVRRVIYVFLALAIVVPSTVFLITYSTVSVPEPGDLESEQVATILGSDGESEISKVIPPQGNRSEVSIDQIPPHVRNAVMAAEDRNFYSNPGFSTSGFVRAARDNVLGRDSAGGGSTITQQYVKNALVGNERSMTRKMQELVISVKMAKQWSKDEILAAYLNTIYFGRGAYGIDAAARAYFDKPVEELSVSEGAVLAGTIRTPSSLDPETNPEEAEARWNYVIDGMTAEGNIPPEQRQQLQFPEVISQSAVGDNEMDAGPNGLVKTQVLQELSEAGISEQQLNTEGLKITTTIDPNAQQAAVDAARENLEGEPEELRTAVASVDPRTGAVRAYYGGEEGQGYDFANAPLQTGSSFKVFGLAANLDQGKPLSQMYDSSPVEVNGVKVTNVEGESCGMCTIAEATKRSLNTSYYRMQLDMKNGPQKIADMAHSLGIPEKIPGFGETLTEPGGAGPNNGIVLGQYQARPLDMASAYATLAASGMYHKPHFVSKVVTSDGQVLLDRGDPAGERRVSEEVANNVTAAMEPIAGHSRNHGLAGGRQSAAKTGTAQLGDTGENKDAWMVGYTPSLATAAWVGSTDNSPLRDYSGSMVYGSSLPSDVWKDTMDGALEGTDQEKFPKPAPIKGQAGVPEWTAPYSAPPSSESTYEAPSESGPSQVEILPGITIPVPGAANSNPRSRPQSSQQRAQDPGEGPQPGQPVAPSGQGSQQTTTASPDSEDSSSNDSGDDESSQDDSEGANGSRSDNGR